MQQELTLAMYRMEGALAQAILFHYCRTIAVLTGKPEDDIRREIIADRDRLIAEEKQRLDLPS